VADVAPPRMAVTRGAHSANRSSRAFARSCAVYARPCAEKTAGFTLGLVEWIDDQARRIVGTASGPACTGLSYYLLNDRFFLRRAGVRPPLSRRPTPSSQPKQ